MGGVVQDVGGQKTRFRGNLELMGEIAVLRLRNASPAVATQQEKN
jgi:hypothetical protein